MTVPMELLIPINCGGEIILIRMTETKKQGWSYAVPHRDITLGPLQEVPAKYHGELHLWFNEEVLEKLAPNRTPGDEIDAWEQFCTSYERRTQAQLFSIEDLVLATDKVVSYRHEILEITIRGQTCRLEGNEVLNSRKFQVWYQFAFKSPVKFKGDDWENLMFAWMDIAEEGETEETAMLGHQEIEAVLNCLRTQEKTTTKDDFEVSPTLPYLVGEVIYLRGSVIKEFLGTHNSKLGMRKLSSLLKPYTVGRSVQLRVPHGGRSQFWRFDLNKIGLDDEAKKKLKKQVEKQEKTEKTLLDEWREEQPEDLDVLLGDLDKLKGLTGASPADAETAKVMGQVKIAEWDHQDRHAVALAEIAERKADAERSDATIKEALGIAKSAVEEIAPAVGQSLGGHLKAMMGGAQQGQQQGPTPADQLSPEQRAEVLTKIEEYRRTLDAREAEVMAQGAPSVAVEVVREPGPYMDIPEGGN